MCFSRDELMHSNLDRHIPEPVKCQSGNFHAWVVDTRGNVVFDPDFDAYRMTKMLNGIDEDAPLVRHPFTDQKTCVNLVMKNAVVRALRFAEMGIDGLVRPNFCSLNCHYFMRANKGKGYRVVVGAAGWQKDDGEIWFEWG